MEGYHEAIIIPLELFEMVQTERASRSNIEIDENGCTKRKSTKYSTKSKKLRRKTLRSFLLLIFLAKLLDKLASSVYNSLKSKRRSTTWERN